VVKKPLMNDQMRFLALIIASVILLSGCGMSPQALDQGAKKKPRIPELKASVLSADTGGLEVEDMQKLLDDIDKELSSPNITEEDIRRGWYNASEENKKYGTPSSWIWVADGDESRWISPNMLEQADVSELKDLCVKTAGTYTVSCLDTEITGCEYAAKSQCHCIENSKWNEQEGCILTDEEGEFISISQDELMRGWYNGLPNEKKLNTPVSWIWVDAGEDSRWQNPSPN
jgi:hypothetical protein